MNTPASPLAVAASRPADPAESRPMSLAPLRALAALGFVLVGLAGCAPEPEVRTYFVAREADAKPFRPVAEVPEAKYRMLAAVIPMSADRSWFVRCDGPAESVTAAEADFDTFLNSIRVTGNPTPSLAWAVPAGWRVGPPKAMRLVTLQKMDAKRPQEMYISEPLGGTLTANVNRWRTDFVGVKPWSDEEVAEGMKVVQLGGTAAFRFDFAGPGGAKAGGTGRPPGSTN